VNPLIWIRLLAYGERVAFERQRANHVVVAARTDALRSCIIGELRAALDHRALAGDTNRSARDTAVGSDRRSEGFLIATGGGRNRRTMQVSPSGTGVECSYGASDPGSNGVGQGRLQVSFPSRHLTPAVILESGVSTRCDTTSALCEQLLGRLTSRAPLKAERQNSSAARTTRVNDAAILPV